MTDSGIRCACFTGHRQIPHAQGRPVVQALRQEIIHAAGTGNHPVLCRRRAGV